MGNYLYQTRSGRQPEHALTGSVGLQSARSPPPALGGLPPWPEPITGLPSPNGLPRPPVNNTHLPGHETTLACQPCPPVEQPSSNKQLSVSVMACCRLYSARNPGPSMSIRLRRALASSSLHAFLYFSRPGAASHLASQHGLSPNSISTSASLIANRQSDINIGARPTLFLEQITSRSRSLVQVTKK